jgi:hypothetical protein
VVRGPDLFRTVQLAAAAIEASQATKWGRKFVYG